MTRKTPPICHRRPIDGWNARVSVPTNDGHHFTDYGAVGVALFALRPRKRWFYAGMYLGGVCSNSSIRLLMRATNKGRQILDITRAPVAEHLALNNDQANTRNFDRSSGFSWFDHVGRRQVRRGYVLSSSKINDGWIRR